MFVKERFALNDYTTKLLQNMEPNFGYSGFGEFVFYRTYSRIKLDGGQETWADVVTRVINGCMSIRKDWYLKNGISWDERWWQNYAKKMAISLFKMEWMPGGRGLWAMGTEFIYERGSMALNNCGYLDIGDTFEKDLGWLMDALMLGVGVGYSPLRNDRMEWAKQSKKRYDYIIPDSREGWVESCEKQINAIRMGLPIPRMIYDEVRPAGLPIRGFGGISSGPEPLMELHEHIEMFMDWYMSDNYYDSVMLKSDIANMMGVCTVAGNVRRCLPGYSRVYTQTGIKSIKDIVVGERVHTLHGLKSVTNVFRQGRQNVITIRTTNYKQIKCTAKHRFAMLKTVDGVYDWIEAGSLKPGDILLVRHESRDIIHSHLASLHPEFWSKVQPVYVESVSNHDERYETYDIEVEDEHCFFAEDFLVHNSALLSSLSIKDQTFKDLKQYENPKYSYRQAWGWMSNNAVDLEDDDDFEQLNDIAQRVIVRGEPGYKNLQNFKYGRIGKRDKVKLDKARGVNPCQPASALILTPKGICRFDQLTEGDRIWSKTGWTIVERKWSTGFNRVYKYTTTGGYFLGTEDHKIIYDGLKVPVKDTFAIDIITGPNEPSLHFDEQTMMDGLLIGDGSVHLDNICLIIGENDQDYFLHDVNHSIRQRYNKEKWYKVKTNLDPQELPYTYLRRVPKRYLYAEKYIVASFLRGLYSANGSIAGNRVTLKASSFGLVQDVQVMLSSLGISSYYTTNKEHDVVFDNGIYTCKQSYDLNIGPDREKFAKTIGFIQKYKNLDLDFMINELGSNVRQSKSTYDIISIEYIGEEETWDITVDNESHTYWTAGCNVSNCGESLLECFELCNQAETLPTVCLEPKVWLKACEYATLYTSSISLLPTHRSETNRVVARNRRITVGIIDFSGWKHDAGVSKVTKWLREGYAKVRATNQWANGEAGVPEAIRVTTIKPGGTTPKLPGKTPGIGHPTFEYTIRRVNVAKNSPIMPLIIEANIPYEDSVTDKYSYIIEWPIHQGPALPADKVSLWEQAMNLVLVQREWSDNAVSNTLYFKPRWVLKASYDNLDDVKIYIGQLLDNQDDYISALVRLESDYEETIIDHPRLKITFLNSEYKIYQYDPNHEEHNIEPVLSAIAPLTKTVSLLPHTPNGVYQQMPEEGITKEEYLQRKAAIKSIDWSKLNGSDGSDERYCSGPQCEIPLKEIQ